MPELPEVETIAAGLRLGTSEQPAITGRVVEAAWVLWERTLASPSSDEFVQRIVGQEILDVGRRGKFLVFTLTDDVLLVHLRMSGDVLVEPVSTPPAQHHRLSLDLQGSLRLAFNDPRKFGRAWLTPQPQSILGSLGPEPLDETFSAQAFHRKLSERHRQVKPLLLDQGFLAGLGNIYTDEALHAAGLHPLMLSDSLSFTQAEKLLASIRQVLAEGIRRNGASIDWVYRGGDFQNYFRVYQRTGQPCPVCGRPIERMVVGQRGTHYCPVCKRL